jgi:hypothetical protein
MEEIQRAALQPGRSTQPAKRVEEIDVEEGSYQRIRETIFRKNPSSNRQKPPMKSRAIHVRPLPLATSERSKATNHMNKASLRITDADYTTSRQDNPAEEGSRASADAALFLTRTFYSLCMVQVLPPSALDQS